MCKYFFITSCLYLELTPRRRTANMPTHEVSSEGMQATVSRASPQLAGLDTNQGLIINILQ